MFCYLLLFNFQRKLPQFPRNCGYYGQSYPAICNVASSHFRVRVRIRKSCTTATCSSCQMPSSLHQGRMFVVFSQNYRLNFRQLAPGDDLVMSNMYSLLNYIAATSKEIFESSSSSQIMSNP